MSARGARVANPQPEPDGPLAALLERSRLDLERTIEQSEDERELLFIAARLLQMETQIEAYAASLRALLQARISYVTGRVKGQG